MGTLHKTDNKALALKLEIRRQAIRASGLKELQVLDLFAGEGRIWREFRREFKVAAYTPVDKAPRLPGTLKMTIDARTIQAFDMTQFNAVDIDTDGEPWIPWLDCFPRIAQRTLFFLTHGATGTLGSNLSHCARAALGIPLDWDIPRKRELAIFAAPYLLLAENPYSRIIRGWECQLQNITYYALICDLRGNKHGRKNGD